MLSLFPQLLFLAPAGTALLRVAAGLAFVYMAYYLWNNASAVAQERLPVIGTCPPWIASIGSSLMAIVGLLLVFGAWTQAAALLGAIVALKGAFLAKRYPSLFALPRSTNVLLFVICLSLMVTGAGSFAFDLPL